jgi:phosphatidylinositol-bisphosphatase
VLKQTRFSLRKREIVVYEHDFVIWAGDFNYRIDGLSHEEIRNFIERNQLRTLWRCDQLIRLKESETLLSDFIEGELEFNPTYKYVKGSSEYW